MSDRDTHQLNEISAQLEREAPRLARRLSRFDRDRVLLRLVLAGCGICAGIAFMLVDAGAGTRLFGLSLIAVAGWETGRRIHQLRA